MTTPPSPQLEFCDRTDPDLGSIGPGHVCKHGIRWPHRCDPCADAAWAASCSQQLGDRLDRLDDAGCRRLVADLRALVADERTASFCPELARFARLFLETRYPVQAPRPA